MKNIEELTYTVPEMAKALKIGLTSAYSLIHRKGFPIITVGRRKVISKEALLKWIESQVVI